MSEPMTALDTLRQKVEEELRYLEQAGESGAAQRLLAAHRALVVAELAGETDADAMEKAIHAAEEEDRFTWQKNYSAAALVRVAAPLITAPLAAKLAQVEADNALYRMEGDTLRARVASLEATLNEIADAHPVGNSWASERARVASLEATLKEIADAHPVGNSWASERARLALGGSV